MGHLDQSAGSNDGDGETVDEDDLDGAVVSVAELNSRIERLIRDADFGIDYVVGDVTNLGLASSGNLHFDLVDGNAEVHCLRFNASGQPIAELKDGDRVAVTGEVNYYTGGGNVSIIIDDFALLGDSLYHRKIEALRTELAQEGLFDPDEKLTLPDFPDAVGIVTAKDSDGETDIINSVREVNSALDLVVKNTSVQGEHAAELISEAIVELDSRSVDIIVVTRGGGSETDLHAFNEETVARSIFETSTPVVTAIGHESDTVIADYVADERAMTPTDVGSVVAPDAEEWVSRLSQYESELDHRYRDRVTSTLKSMEQQLDQRFRGFVGEVLNELDNQVDGAYTNHLSSTLTRYEASLDGALSKLHQQKQYEEEKDALQRHQTLYKVAILALMFLLLIVIFLWLGPAL